MEPKFVLVGFAMFCQPILSVLSRTVRADPAQLLAPALRMPVTPRIDIENANIDEDKLAKFGI
jgi:hypothetical protein